MPNLKCVRVVDAERARRLGEAVALDHEHPERVEELEHVDAERRGARHADTKPSAEAFLHLGEDELVGEALLHAEAERHRPLRAAQAARARSDTERPAAERALDAALVLDPVEDARVDLLVDPRHRGEDGRAHGAERLRHARGVGDERDGRRRSRPQPGAPDGRRCGRAGGRGGPCRFRPRGSCARAAPRSRGSCA